MRKVLWITLLTLFFSSLSYAARPVYILDITGAIGPATQDYVNRGLATANQQHAALVVLRLNTHGGLAKSIHKIVQAIVASPIPVASYVAPAGAYAANTSTFILYASSIAAMAPNTYLDALPNTNLPQINSLKDTLTLPFLKEKKLDNAVADIRHLATLRHRNPDLAESLLRNPLNLSASDALKEKVINLIADNIPQLLQKLDGTTVEMRYVPVVIATQGAAIEILPPTWRYHVLSIITNPIAAYLLLLLGILCTFLEFSHPGKVVPGLVGFICLMITFYAFQLLPVSFFGLTCVLIGIVCMIAEIALAKRGVIGACGIITFNAGSLFLLDMDSPGYYLTWPTILFISLASASLFYLILSFAVKRNQKSAASPPSSTSR